MTQPFRSIFVVFSLICLIFAAAGCAPMVVTGDSQTITGSGKLVTQSYDLSSFDSISATSNFDVKVHQGDQFAVSTTADDNMAQNLVVEKVGDQLRLGLKPGSWSLNNVTMKADVTLPALKSLTLDGNATANIEKVKSPSLAFDLKSNGIVQGNVEAGKLLVDGGGNAQARLSGTADDLTVNGQGNALLTLDGLTAKTAFVDIGSNAKAAVKATEKLDYSVGGNAGLTYTGGAQLGEQKTAGNATARGR